jgi:tetratricopeptide (TPR) repeat protein
MLFFLRTLRPEIALAVLLASSGFAAEIPREWDLPRQEISDAWRVRKEVVSLGNDPIGAKQLEQIRKSQRKFGLTSLPLVSLSLIGEVRERGSAQKEERLRYAELFAPDLPAIPYLHCADTGNLNGLIPSAISCLQGLRLDLSRSEGRLRLLANGFFAALSTYLFVAFLFVSFFLYRHGTTLCREISERLTYVTPVGVSFLLLLLSLVGWVYLGWIGAGSILFFFLWRHAAGRERFVLIALWVAAVLLPWAMYAPALLVRYERGIVSTLEKPLEGTSLTEKGILLRRWISDHPEDAEALFTLGIIEKKTGRFESAKSLFGKASALRPDWHKPIVNLATIAFVEKETDVAISLLQKAVSIAPQSVTAHFDLGKIYLNETRLDEARNSLKKAKDIDAALFAELDRASNAASVSDYLMDETLTRREILPRIWSFSPDLTDHRETLYRTRFPNIPIPLYGWILAAVLLLSFGIHLKWPPGIRSGERAGSEDRAPSSSLDIFDPTLSRAFKREYSPLHAFWEKFQERFSTFLLPGLHHLFRGEQVRALFWLSTSVGILVLISQRDLWIRDPLSLPGIPTFPLTETLLVTFGILYLYEAIRAIRS